MKRTHWPLRLLVEPQGNTVSVNGTETCSSDCQFWLPVGQVAQLVPNSTRDFLRFEGDCFGRACQLSPARSLQVKAVFQTRVQLAISAGGPGHVKWIDDGGQCRSSTCALSVVPGAFPVDVTPDSNARLLDAPEECDGGQRCDLNVQGDRLAEFRFIRQWPVTVALLGSGQGQVKLGNQQCSSQCSFLVDEATPISLTAEPGAGVRFLGWDGGCSGSAVTCDVTVASAVSVSASFQRVVQPINVEPDNDLHYFAATALPDGRYQVAGGLLRGTVWNGTALPLNANSADLVFAQVSSSGQVDWIVRSTNDGGFATATQVRPRPDGGSVLAGIFDDRLVMPGLGLVGQNNRDALFIITVDDSGGVIDTFTLGNTQDLTLLGLDVSSGGEILVSGSYRGSLSFDGGSTISTTATVDGFWLLLDSTLQPRRMQGLGAIGGVALANARFRGEDVVVLGEFYNHLDFGCGPSSAQFTRTAPGAWLGLARYTANGTCLNSAFVTADAGTRIEVGELAVLSNGDVALQFGVSGELEAFGRKIIARPPPPSIGPTDLAIMSVNSAFDANWVSIVTSQPQLLSRPLPEYGLAVDGATIGLMARMTGPVSVGGAAAACPVTNPDGTDLAFVTLDATNGAAKYLACYGGPGHEMATRRLLRGVDGGFVLTAHASPGGGVSFGESVSPPAAENSSFAVWLTP